MIELYQQRHPSNDPEVQAMAEEIDLEFLTEDIQKIISSLRVGTERIRGIVVSLRNFSRMDEADFKYVDIHEGIESTLLILQHRLKDKPECPAVVTIKDYGNLPKVECFPGQLNQVFMNTALCLTIRYNSRGGKKKKNETLLPRYASKDH
jgi:signal transduction histidine kinase